jgi:hypothetical protein
MNSLKGNFDMYSICIEQWFPTCGSETPPPWHYEVLARTPRIHIISQQVLLFLPALGSCVILFVVVTNKT